MTLRHLSKPGPAGVGKSATVRALAADMGFEIVEWTSPVPTLFEEHLHARGTDFSIEYQSKVGLPSDTFLPRRPPIEPFPLPTRTPAILGFPTPAGVLLYGL